MKTGTCPVCRGKKWPSFATCGNSACQEAAYYANVARTAPKRKRAAAEAEAFKAIQRATPFCSFASVELLGKVLDTSAGPR